MNNNTPVGRYDQMENNGDEFFVGNTGEFSLVDDEAEIDLTDYVGEQEKSKRRGKAFLAIAGGFLAVVASVSAISILTYEPPVAEQPLQEKYGPDSSYKITWIDFNDPNIVWLDGYGPNE